MANVTRQGQKSQSQKEQRVDHDRALIVPGTPLSKSCFPGPVVTHREDKETREGRKRGEPSRTGLVSCMDYEVCGARDS